MWFDRRVPDTPLADYIPIFAAEYDSEVVLPRRYRNRLTNYRSAAVYVGSNDEAHPAFDARRIMVPAHETERTVAGGWRLVTDSGWLALCGTPTVYAHPSKTDTEVPKPVAELAARKRLRVGLGDFETLSVVTELIADSVRNGLWMRRAVRSFSMGGGPIAELLAATGETT